MKKYTMKKLLELLRHFLGQIAAPFFQAFAQQVAGKPPDADIFTGFGNHLLHQLFDGQIRIFDKFLFHQAVFSIKFLYSAGDNFVNNFFQACRSPGPGRGKSVFPSPPPRQERHHG